MTKVRLITTGIAEKNGLPKSLQRYFTNLTFLDSLMTDSLTSTYLTLKPELPSPFGRLAKYVVAELMRPSAHNDTADIICFVDDLEICNLGNAGNIVKMITTAVHSEITKQFSTAVPRYLNFAKKKVSIHFLVPHLEAYFFGCARALSASTSATAYNQKNCRQISAKGIQLNTCCWHNLEGFLTSDLRYDSFINADPDLKRHPLYYQMHPKHYVKFLSQQMYRESEHGKKALESIDWKCNVRLRP